MSEKTGQFVSSREEVSCWKTEHHIYVFQTNQVQRDDLLQARSIQKLLLISDVSK